LGKAIDGVQLRELLIEAIRYLDYRPLKEEKIAAIEPILKQSLLREDIESQAKTYAIAEIVPQHLNELKQHKEESKN
jgi:hypothetical protein